MGRWGRALVYSISSVLVVAIAYSRVYLGAHWFSDVVAGLLFGAVMAMAFAIAIEAIPPRRIRPVGLFGASLIAFIIAGTAHVALGYRSAEERYAPPQRLVFEGLGLWSATGWKNLPVRRVDLVGRTGEVFVAQLNGSLDSLRLALSTAGWSETPKWSWRGALPYLNPSATLSELPPRPALHEGLQAKFTAVRTLANEQGDRLVLRAFKTNLMVKSRDRAQPVYLISITREFLRHGLNLYAVPSGSFAAPAEISDALTAFSTSRHLHQLNANPEPALYMTVP